MRLQDILRLKGTHVHVISPDAALDEVVRELIAHNCGSLVVCEAGAGAAHGPMVGIITERDILRACAAGRGPLDRLKVAEIMSRRPLTAAPNDTLDDAMGRMTEHRIRHLPSSTKDDWPALSPSATSSRHITTRSLWKTTT